MSNSDNTSNRRGVVPRGDVPESLDFDTLAVRAGTQRSQFGEHSEALYLTI